MTEPLGEEPQPKRASAAPARAATSSPAGRAILHISLGRGRFSQQDIDGYLDWAEAARPDLGFLIGDRLHMHSYAVLHRVELLLASRRVEAVGRQIETRVLAAAAARGQRPEVLRWADIERADAYWSLLACADALYHEQQAFHNEVRRALWRSLGDRLGSIGLTPESPQEDERLAQLDRAVLHEIAGLITLAEHLAHPVLVDRGPDLTILTRIYRGDFPPLARFLREPALRQFLPLEESSAASL